MLKAGEKAVLIKGSPFESIRSSEIHGLLSSYFRDTVFLERKFMGFLYPAILTLDFSDWSDTQLQQLVEKCIEVDRAVTRLGLLSPCFLFGIYRKTEREFSPVLPWSSFRIHKELSPIWHATPLRLAKWATL